MNQDRNMSLDVISDYINSLKLRAGNVAFFCGSGISRDSGLPTADDLKSEILASLGFDEKKQSIINNFRVPFEGFIEKLSDFINLDQLFEFFSKAIPDLDHLFLAKAYKNGLTRTILTTNFDTCLEKALKNEVKNSHDMPIILYEEDQFDSLQQINETDDPVLIKIHGTSENFSSIRATVKSVANHTNLSKRKIPIDYLFSSGKHNIVIILGYSCSDIFDISPAIENIVGSDKEVIIVDHDPERIAIEDISVKEERNPFKNYRGKRIFIDTKDFIKMLAEKFSISLSSLEMKHGNYWKKEVKSFFFNRFKEDPSLRFTLSGTLLQLVSEHREAIGYFNKALNASKQQGKGYNIARALAHLGNSFAQIGNFEKAIQNHQESLKICISAKDNLKIFELRSNLAQDYIQKGDTKSALKFVNDNYALATSLKDETMILHSHMETSTIDLIVGFYDDGIDRLNKSKELLLKRGELYSLVAVLGNTGTIFLELGNYKEALKNYSDALEFAEKIGDRSMIAECNGAIGSYYMNIENPLKAMEYFEKELYISRQINSSKMIAYSLRLIGNCLSQMGKLKESFTKYQESLSIAKRIGDIESSARAVGDISMYFLNIRDFRSSIINLNEAKKLAESVTSPYLSVWLMVNEARIYAENGEAKKAEKIHNQAINISMQVRNRYLMSLVYHDAADRSMKLGNPKNAIKYMLEFIDFIKETPNKHEIANSYMKLAFYYSQMRDYDNSKKTYEKSMQLALQINDAILIGHINNGLGGCYIELGDLQNARIVLDKAVSIFKQTNNLGLEAETHYYRSLMFIKESSWDLGLDEAKKSYEISIKVGNPERISFAALNIGICSEKLGDFISSKEFFTSAEKTAKELNLLGLLYRISEFYDRGRIVSDLRKILN